MNNAQMLLRKVAGAGTMNSYGDRFAVGADGRANHIAALDNLTMKEIYNDDVGDKIVVVCADFIVLSSDCMKPGTKASEKYDIGKMGNGGTSASKRLNGLARAVVEGLGHTQKPEDTDGKAFEKLVGDTLIKLLEIDPATGLTRTTGRKFTGRGISVKVFSKEVTAGSKSKSAGKKFVNNDYTALAQTPENIKAKRAAIEAPPTAQAQTSAPAAASKAATKPTPAPQPEPEAVDEEMEQISLTDDASGDMLEGLE